MNINKSINHWDQNRLQLNINKSVNHWDQNRLQLNINKSINHWDQNRLQWWWFPFKPKHVGAVLLILKCSNNSMFFNVVCISWKLKCWILLMHGVTMKFTVDGDAASYKISRALSSQWNIKRNNFIFIQDKARTYLL